MVSTSMLLPKTTSASTRVRKWYQEKHKEHIVQNCWHAHRVSTATPCTQESAYVLLRTPTNDEDKDTDEHIGGNGVLRNDNVLPDGLCGVDEAEDTADELHALQEERPPMLPVCSLRHDVGAQPTHAQPVALAVVAE